MITYKAKDTGKNRIMYYINGKLVSPKVVPDAIKLRLDPDSEITIDGTLDTNIEEIQESIKTQLVRTTSCPNIVIDTNKCLFHPEVAATHVKFLDQQHLGLCDEHYMNTSTGKIVAKLHELAL